MEESIKINQQYRLVVENTSDIVSVHAFNLKSTYLYASPSIKIIKGYEPEELIGKSPFEFIHPEDKKKLRLLLKKYLGNFARKLFTGEEPYYVTERIEYRFKNKEGNWRYLQSTGNLVGNKLIFISRDITELRQAEIELKKSYKKLQKTMDASIDTVSKIIEAKDSYTSGHQHKVCQLAVRIAREMKLPQDKIEGIRVASLIHDIGKIGLSTEILSKPTKLNDIEFSLIKAHSQIGYDILKSVEFPWPVAEIVLQHHERVNGSGYPRGLKGDEILIEAKVIAVADVVEAMSSHRPYRPALGIDAALEEISKNKGILYDPEVVDACLKLFKEKKFKF
ncbi:MAG: HD domain-containing protein [Candidatus Caldatribacteriota bacterium]|nr:HD domain-containing protein [Candidatus Caldatribacteriota bacterium]